MKHFRLLSHDLVDFVVREDGALCSDTSGQVIQYTWFSAENREEAEQHFHRMLQHVSHRHMGEAEAEAEEILDIWDFDRVLVNVDLLRSVSKNSWPRIYRLPAPLKSSISIPFDRTREARITPAHLWRGKLSERAAKGLTRLVNMLELNGGGFSNYYFAELIEALYSVNHTVETPPVPDGTVWFLGSCGRYLVIIGVVK